MNRWAIGIVILALGGSPVSPLCETVSEPGQEAGPYRPKLTNPRGKSFQDFPMGVLSATGRVEDGESDIQVVDIGKGGAADRAGLKVDDRIVTIRGRRPGVFSMKTDTGLAGPQEALAEALDRACGTVPNRLRLTVQRGEEKKTLSIPVPRARAFASTFPKRCSKSRRYLEAIADHLVATQRKNGSWKPGVGGDADVYMSAFCALAVLSANKKGQEPTVRRAIEFIRKKSIAKIDPSDPKVGPKNWQAAVTAILLAEFHLATGDRSVLADLEKCCDLLAVRVTEKGTMGHHFDIPYKGGGLVIINAQAHLAWALAAKCGIAMDQGAWDRSLREIRASIHRKTGAVGYSSRAPGSPDIAARTGAMAAALSVSGRELELARSLSDSLVKLPDRMRHAHAMSSIGLIYGLAGIRTVDVDGHAKVLRRWKPYLELCRTSAGPASYFGGKRNIGGDEYLGLHPIGNATVALMLASAEGKLFMHGGTRKKWFGAGKR